MIRSVFFCMTFLDPVDTWKDVKEKTVCTNISWILMKKRMKTMDKEQIRMMLIKMMLVMMMRMLTKMMRKMTKIMRKIMRMMERKMKQITRFATPPNLMILKLMKRKR